MRVEIWHNPACGTSRNALALIRHAGIEPDIVEYLQATPDKARLREAISAAGLSVREAIRSKQPEYLALGLDDESLSDEALLDAMVATPILINRPFVFSPLGVRLCRPDSSMVLDILPPCDKPFTKEDGGVVIDERGNRVR
ncbi:arsenate reductase (glutaredoxin) [Thermomonas sp. HDW16]|uniref:arsenate reductase (glutaredoxin) n=1 Tax=Thermomonas sp. HDW16 TaxID=2714945 RepID=UPI00140DF82F|nr:arsenate reductase (glutaredoxin) [Thermomonas sp. HDW16]